MRYFKILCVVLFASFLVACHEISIGITFLCFFIGYSVVECVTGKEKKDDQ